MKDVILSSALVLFTLGCGTSAAGTGGAEFPSPAGASSPRPSTLLPPLLPAPSPLVRQVIPFQRSLGCSAAQVTTIPSLIPSPLRAHFFEECDQPNSYDWTFWIAGTQADLASPEGWYINELGARGFVVSRYTKDGTPFHLEFSGHGLTGQIWTVAHDPPVEATGERFVLIVSIVLNR
ncbi:MAG: hypothetical protein KGK34_07445 [Chloroflexota bacterium]|nr:hypothetical protein [Chloroflexota bacterium]